MEQPMEPSSTIRSARHLSTGEQQEEEDINTSRRSSVFELANHASLKWARHDSLDRTRHKTEYETLGVLGKGAFGVTYKVKNKVDSKIYALKRVYLGTDSEEDASKVLKEVEALSSLHSDNVVGYYGAWIEKGGANSHSSTSADGSSGDYGSSGCYSNFTSTSWSQSDTTTNSNNRGENGTTATEQPVCHLCQSTYRDWEVSLEHWGLIDAVLQPQFLCIDCYQASLPQTVDLSTIRIRETMPLYLFILLEYCESTLQEALLENFQVQDENSKKNTKDDLLLWKYFAQCVAGLEHCHSQNLIHRDIKPANIFIHQGVAKLGDLGLATQNINSIGSASRSFDSVDNQQQQPRQQQPRTRDELKPAPQDEASHSSRVGTFLYSAPEVNSGKYNEKCDIFSLGVVAFEMWSKFSTGMERADVLSRLQSGKLPQNWIDDNPIPAKIVGPMIHADPAKRPSCAQILTTLMEEGLIPDQSSGNSIVLERLVSDLQSRNKKLQESLNQKEQTIEQLCALLREHGISHDHITV